MSRRYHLVVDRIGSSVRILHATVTKPDGYEYVTPVYYGPNSYAIGIGARHYAIKTLEKKGYKFAYFQSYRKQH